MIGKTSALSPTLLRLERTSGIISAKTIPSGYSLYDLTAFPTQNFIIAVGSTTNRPLMIKIDVSTFGLIEAKKLNTNFDNMADYAQFDEFEAR